MVAHEHGQWTPQAVKQQKSALIAAQLFRLLIRSPQATQARCMATHQSRTGHLRTPEDRCTPHGTLMGARLVSEGPQATDITLRFRNALYYVNSASAATTEPIISVVDLLGASGPTEAS